MTRFYAFQSTSDHATDAACAAPAACCATTATSAFEIILDTAILAVSIFISLITITIGLGGLLINLLVWALVAVKFHSMPNSNVFAARKRTAA